MVRTLAVGFALAALALACAPSQAVADPQAFAIGKCVDPSQPTQQRPNRFAYN
ncbi:MAG: hypothetical protein QOJ80_4081, partial [Mycobacterium sp.]|nr:hypothetical protein [Mycobacterium sp.]